MRASRLHYEHAVIVHRRSALIAVDALDAADRFIVAHIPRPAFIRNVEPMRRDRPPRREVWFNARGKRS